ncbi:hypothetical protein KAS45_05395, partial [candidate division WOR-3 bacterium]|nr:hypothetical protein [candidate division WOR-3 bacterium]
MNKILTFLLLVTLSSAGQIRLVRDGTTFPLAQPPVANLTLKLVSESSTLSMPVRRFQNLRLFQDFLAPLPKEGRDERNVLVLKVEFVEDDIPCTSGDGKMDLTGF